MRFRRSQRSLRLHHVRFGTINAFVVARTTGGPEHMKQEKERALDYFTDEFRKMMAENLDDFIANLEKYDMGAGAQ